jgi:FMN phosphatase YigB (HAD superfamily)
VIATDNMDCFVRAFERARRRRPRRGEAWVTMADWAGICDDIISSSEVGALKEDPQSFFGPWLDRHGMTFRDAVLVDDRPDNCAAFSAQGGTAIQWKMGTQDVGEVVSALRSWVEARGLARS